MKKYYRVNEAKNIIAIAETSEGNNKAIQKGYTKITIKNMTSGEKACLTAYNKNKPTCFPAIFLG